MAAKHIQRVFTHVDIISSAHPSLECGGRGRSPAIPLLHAKIKKLSLALAALLTSASVFAIDLNNHWQLLTGSRALETIAAEVFREEAVERFAITLPAPQAGFSHLIATTPYGHPRARMQQMYNWAQLAVLIWESQYHHLSGLALINALGGEKADFEKIRSVLVPLTRDSIRNTEAILLLMNNFAPNMNLTSSHTQVVENALWRDGEAHKLQGKLDAMRAELRQIEKE